MRIGWTILIWLTLGGVGAAEEARCPKGEAPIQLEDIEAAPFLDKLVSHQYPDEP